RPDYVLHDFELVALDDEGRETFTLRAPTMPPNPGERSMEMATPVFLLPDSERHYWQVVAEEGWVGPEGQELRLTGDVRVTSPPEERKVAMNTEQLNIFPDTDMAIAPGVVTITQPGSILRGRGLETNLASKRYECKSQVHTRYVPQSPGRSRSPPQAAGGAAGLPGSRRRLRAQLRPRQGNADR